MSQQLFLTMNKVRRILFISIVLVLSMNGYAETYLFKKGCYESFLNERPDHSLLEQIELDQILSVVPVQGNGYDEYMPSLEAWTLNKELGVGYIHAIGVLKGCSKIRYHFLKEDGLEKNFDDFLLVHKKYSGSDLVVRYSKDGYKFVVGVEKHFDINAIDREPSDIK